MRRAKSLGPVLFLLVLPVLFAGCSSTYSFKVNALKNEDVQESHHRTYKLTSPDPEIDETDPQYYQVAEYVRAALAERGLVEAGPNEKADMVIEVDYGMSDPHVEVRANFKSPFELPSGVSRTVSKPVVDEEGNVTYKREAVMIYEPDYYPVTTYEKYLELKANEYGDEDPNEVKVQLWSVRVKSVDESDELEKYLPMMAAAAVPYVGEDTGEQREIKLREDDHRVAYVKNGL